MVPISEGTGAWLGLGIAQYMPEFACSTFAPVNRPIGRSAEVTEARENHILGLDGQPALDVVSPLHWASLSSSVCLQSHLALSNERADSYAGVSGC